MSFVEIGSLISWFLPLPCQAEPAAIWQAALGPRQVGHSTVFANREQGLVEALLVVFGLITRLGAAV